MKKKNIIDASPNPKAEEPAPITAENAGWSPEKREFARIVEAFKVANPKIYERDKVALQAKLDAMQ